MRTNPTQLLARIGAFPAGILVIGFLWAFFDVFVLGHWEPKFGRWGSFQLGLLVVVLLATVALLTSGLVVWLLRRRTAGWTARRHVVVGLVAALLSFAVLASGLPAPVTDWVADRTESIPAIVLTGVATCVGVMGIVLGAAVLAGGTSKREGAQRG